jgi:hypothetical protein
MNMTESVAIYYEVPLKKECEQHEPTTSRPKKCGFGRKISRSASSSSLSLASSQGGSDLDNSMHIRDLVENDSHSCHLSVQNSVDLTRRRRTTREAVAEVLEDSLSLLSIDSDLDDGSVSSGLTLDSTLFKKKQRVRFRLANNEYFASSDEPLTDEEIDDAWWTPEDYDKAVEVTEEYIDNFHSLNNEPMQDLIRLVALCYKAKEDKFDDLKHAVSLTPTVSRGFESEIIHPIKKSRKRHARSVLNILHRNPENPEKAAECSKVLSRPHTLLAIAYAQRDYQVAKEAASVPWRKRKSSCSSRRKR